MTNSFTDIVAWQKAHELVLLVYKITNSFPQYERFGLWSQFTRAAVSVAANIAEGYKKLSKADKLKFFNIAQGSLEECRYYTILSKDLNYISEEQCSALHQKLTAASIYLNAYIKGLANNSGIKEEIE